MLLDQRKLTVGTSSKGLKYGIAAARNRERQLVVLVVDAVGPPLGYNLSWLFSIMGR